MQLGMIGLGRMGAGMVRRLMRDGHDCVVHDRNPEAVADLADEGATGAADIEELVEALDPPRTVWIMVAAGAVDGVIGSLAPLLEAGDTVVDGGNSRYHDDIRRAVELAERQLHHVDVGTSGGVWGLENGYCLMIGGEDATVRRLEPLFESLAPGLETAPRTAGKQGPASPEEKGWLHCGPAGAGHLVKMVHNGIEYGVMAAYAEGLNLLAHAGVGFDDREHDAETTPLDHPEHYRYEIDLAAVTEVWRRGSVIRSWLLDLTARALADDPGLQAYEGRVSDSGEGRWTIQAAIDVAVPAPVISAALFARFSSRGESDLADRVLSAMRHQFGGHEESEE